MPTPLTTTLQGPMRELLVSGARRDLARGPGDPDPRTEQQERLRRLQESNTLVVDDRRRRPLYFDGRFLAARDLTREQAYFLTRQADLGRAGGAGVVHGLEVRLPDDADGRALRV